MKVAIVGSRKYSCERKIKDLIYKLKTEFEENVIVVSGGCNQGADKIAKKFALELGVNYEEYPPCHASYNEWCRLPAYLYGKNYSPRNFFIRNDQIAENSDVGFCFIPKGVKANGTMHTHKCFEKRNKKVVVIT